MVFFNLMECIWYFSTQYYFFTAFFMCFMGGGFVSRDAYNYKINFSKDIMAIV